MVSAAGEPARSRGGGVVVAGALDQGDRRGAAAVHDPLAAGASRRCSEPLAAIALGAIIGYAVFGIHGIDIVAALNRDAAFVSSDSFATEIAHLFGKPGRVPDRPRPAEGRRSC